MNILFYQILLVVFAALFTVASFGESRQSSRYADHVMTFVMMVPSMITVVRAMLHSLKSLPHPPESL